MVMSMKLTASASSRSRGEHLLDDQDAGHSSPRSASPRPPPPSTTRQRRPSNAHSLFSYFGAASDDDSSEEERKTADRDRGRVFIDAEAMKNTVRENLMKEPYDVSKYYHETGLWQAIARSGLFEKLTLLIIAVNAIWIGIDTDHNQADVLLAAKPHFQIAEHFFCIYFSFEWLVRYMSFKKKRNGLKDGWFVFDSLLVFMMVFETWVLTIVMLAVGAGGGSGLGDASILRMARLARLTRMARMARLLRVMPELMILIKGIATATRSVFFTLCLLGMLLYIFSIAFTQLLVDSEVGAKYFPDVGTSMYTLLVYGTLMDNIGTPLAKLGKESALYAALYLLFVLLATITVMNMLIGVLCDVVSAVAAVEKETMAVTFVKSKLDGVLQSIDENGDGTISKDEFSKVLLDPSAVQALSDVGVDVPGLTDFADFIFMDEEGTGDIELTFPQFMDIMLQFRGTNVAHVKDIVDLHKFVKMKLSQTMTDIREVKDLLGCLTDCMGDLSEPGQLAEPTQPMSTDDPRSGWCEEASSVQERNGKGLDHSSHFEDVNSSEGYVQKACFAQAVSVAGLADVGAPQAVAQAAPQEFRRPISPDLGSVPQPEVLCVARAVGRWGSPAPPVLEHAAPPPGATLPPLPQAPLRPESPPPPLPQAFGALAPWGGWSCDVAAPSKDVASAPMDPPMPRALLRSKRYDGLCAGVPQLPLRAG
eukprot:CAMPEP_0176090638 /NCGR_PEP_ID=MMETSP0120_2-20121206/45393_1 /TAXON_ID=160619 /ORGANISM="Kryptoperidinium foliaceum, Strain CCMP 1326" /LENGTH=704 /DNA_ID=CAMNT_0017424519 /DNA_START=65 /DNA_END=2179 /DNA_ORIENTATION=+